MKNFKKKFSLRLFMKFKLFLIFVFILMIGCSPEKVVEVDNDLVVEVLLDDLQSPWGLSFIDDDLLLITEKSGNLILVNLSSLETNEINGLPDVSVVGQGGLLDVNYDNNFVYLTYSASNGNGYATHLGKGLLDLDNLVIDEFEVLHIATPFMSGGSHFGSRVVVFEDYVFYSTGDRGQKNFGVDHVSQDTMNYLGTVIRLYKNGSVPEDNPFVDNAEVLDGIYSYGHRNIQGLTINPFTKELWASDHGERDGDEINIILPGRNYGWPITHTGCRYGTNIPVADDPFDNPDITNPVFYWKCGSGGFPPAGMTFYDGEVDDWYGKLFLGGLASQYLASFEVNNEVIESNPLLKDKGWRIRDVKQSSNDLYVITDNGNLVRISK